jgi:hypothetical protein
MEKREWVKFKAEHRRKPKRKPEEDENIPTGWKRQPKRSRRIASCEEITDLQEWWRWVVERCMRAGKLSTRLETKNKRVTCSRTDIPLKICRQFPQNLCSLTLHIYDLFGLGMVSFFFFILLHIKILKIV